MSSASAVRQFTTDVGTLVERHDRAKPRNFTKYRGRPADFLREVLGMQLWSRQLDIVDRYLRHRLSAVVSAQGVGKTHVLAGIVLYHIYVERGYVVACGPTARQVEGLLFMEIRRLWQRDPDLPGELFQSVLRVDAHTAAVGIVTTGASQLTGIHHERLLVCVDESQGCLPWVFEAALALATGEQNKILAIGNPGPPVGRWYDMHHSDRWAHLRISATEHPNVVQGREVIPGAVSRAFIEDLAREYGPESSVYKSRVLGEFAEDDGQTLCRREWLDAAAQRFRDGSMEIEASKHPYVVALDVARLGPDRSVLTFRQGPVVREFCSWGRTDTVLTVEKTLDLCRARDINIWTGYARSSAHAGAEPVGLFEWGRRGHVVVDEAGVGGGVVDQLRDKMIDVRPFLGAGSPPSGETSRYLNRRASAAWALRRMLEEGRLALPPDPLLFEELLALTWRTNLAGKMLLEPKEDFRTRVGRSCDHADATMMACEDWDLGRRNNWRVGRFRT